MLCMQHVRRACLPTALTDRHNDGDNEDGLQPRDVQSKYSTG